MSAQREAGWLLTETAPADVAVGAVHTKLTWGCSTWECSSNYWCFFLNICLTLFELLQCKPIPPDHFLKCKQPLFCTCLKINMSSVGKWEELL